MVKQVSSAYKLHDQNESFVRFNELQVQEPNKCQHVVHHDAHDAWQRAILLEAQCRRVRCLLIGG